MAVAAGTFVLLTGSVVAAVCALFWPQIEQAYLVHTAAQGSGATSAAGAKGKCPLGYEGTMPSNHPPINLPGGGRIQAAKATIAGKSQLVTYAHANIWTGDIQNPWAVNMTVNLGTGDIVSLGYADGSSSQDGKVVDLNGAFVMPGFVDPHVHLIPGGLFLSKVNLRALAGGRQEFAERVAAAAAVRPDSSSNSSGSEGQSNWILGIGWSESDWGGELPHRTWIDEACAGRPTFLSRMDSHMALVNTAALEAAGLMTTPAAAAAEGGKDTADADFAAAVAAADAEGLIDRDSHTGLPTGLLRESAMYLVERLIPAPTVADRTAALKEAGRYLLSRGVTSVGDMGWGLFGSGNLTWEDLEQVYDVAAKDGSMPVRVSVYVPLRTWPRLASRVAAHGTHHPHSTRLVWGGTKEFADGSLGSSTALMWEPYADATAATAADSSSSSSSQGHSSGTRVTPTDELSKLMKGAVGAGLQVAVHAIGDRAVDEVMDAFEGVLSSSSSSSSSSSARQLQHRIEHVQHISTPTAATRMAKLGIAGVPNPQHLLTDWPMLISKLGFERAGPGRAFAYKTLQDAGVRLGFGSDWPVVEINPWESVFAAVYRRDPTSSSSSIPTASAAADGEEKEEKSDVGGGVESEKVWESEGERLGLSEVLLSHTLEAARVNRLDHWVGKLAPGYKADFVVLNRSPFAASDMPTGSTTAAAAADDDDDDDESAGDTEHSSVSQGSGLLGSLPSLRQTYMDGVCLYGCAADSDAVATQVL